jgi:hypothetical protein
MRRACRRGVVAHNQVRQCVGRWGGGIDVLGESVVAATGVDAVLNERLLIAGNHVECQAAYGGAMRAKACRLVDVVGNTVEMYGSATPPGGVRYGIFVGNKEYTDSATAAQSNCENVRVLDNRVVAQSNVEGGIYGLNNNATTNVANKNIAFVGNQLIEAEGTFTIFGIRYGQDATNSGATIGLTIRDNHGWSSLGNGTASTGYGALVVIGHGTDGAKSISLAEIADNTVISRASPTAGNQGGIFGVVSGVRFQNNKFVGYSNAFQNTPSW